MNNWLLSEGGFFWVLLLEIQKQANDLIAILSEGSFFWVLLLVKRLGQNSEAFYLLSWANGLQRWGHCQLDADEAQEQNS